MIGQELLVDTSAWLALADADDAYHQKAKKNYPFFLKKYQKLITTNLIVSESYVNIGRSLGKEAALSFLGKIRESPRIEKVYSTSSFEEEAHKLLKKYADQDFSFVDAVSFALMKERKIKKAFAFDVHFVTAGFALLP